MVKKHLSNNQKDIVTLSVVILGYGAGYKLKDFTKEVVDLLVKEGINWEIILVANYWPDSKDITPMVAKELADNDNRIKVVAQPKQGYMGWDMRSGLNVAHGEYIAFIDGDGQMPAEDIIRVYEEIKIRELDLVKTFREKRFDSLTRRVVSWIYNQIFKFLFPHFPIRDVNSKPKIFTREAYDKLHLISDDWFIDAEIMIQARRYKFKFTEIPTIFKRIDYRPSYVKLSAILEFIKNLIRAKISGL